MYFLVDFENVKSTGMDGTEFLEKGDKVIIFYSECCKKLKNHYLEDIKKSMCEFEICRLQTVRHNALDFYIASMVGEIFATDKEARVGIISNDKGFESVIEYCRARFKVGKRITRASNISIAIVSACEDEKRRTIADEKTYLVDFEEEFIKIEERRSFAKIIRAIFDGTEYEKFVPEIIAILWGAKEPKKLYLDSLKSFGKKTGTEVYRKIKENDMISICVN